MITRLAGACAVAALVMGALVGCSTPTDPAEPTPLFTSEEQAFAAAEETYRAYVDALNQVDLSDPATFEPVFALTTGEANAVERKSLSTMHGDGWVVSGASEVERIDQLSASSSLDSIEIGACVNVSSVALVDANGASQVGSNRPSVQSTRVTLIESGQTDPSYLISEIVGSELDPACSE